ncbi:tyrosine-type recombinase/integrase [Alkalihalobacillus deserti]|uniref:tyrosine-type recombinase/integrase n=1 Tax=Alkalihalobacillus deserti TaxID=2879466 RepID=UPI003557FBBD
MMFCNEYFDQDFVTAKPSGYPQNSLNVNKYLKRLLKLARIERHLTPHSLWHTHIEAGVGIKEIQQRLGHTNVDTTMNIYAHMTMKKKPHNSSVN